MSKSTLFKKIKKYRESPIREYDVEIPGEWHDAGGACFTITDRTRAINPDDAKSVMSKRYGRKNERFYNEDVGNRTYDIDRMKTIEYQGPGKPITESQYQKLLEKYKF